MRRFKVGPWIAIAVTPMAGVAGFAVSLFIDSLRDPPSASDHIEEASSAVDEYIFEYRSDVRETVTSAVDDLRETVEGAVQEEMEDAGSTVANDIIISDYHDYFTNEDGKNRRFTIYHNVPVNGQRCEIIDEADAGGLILICPDEVSPG